MPEKHLPITLEKEKICRIFFVLSSKKSIFHTEHRLISKNLFNEYKTVAFRRQRYISNKKHELRLIGTKGITKHLPYQQEKPMPIT
jgi:hypothetical protein